MICLAIRFPGGRFHATPWGHHVNEGVPEWPPSPYRIVRALASALYTRRPGADVALGRAVLGKLSAPPLFTLPPASTGHTRHYLSKNEKDRAATMLTFDTFVAVDAAEAVYVHWPVDLARSEEAALRAMVAEVSYLGRAEAWCEMELVNGPAPAPGCMPGQGEAGPGQVAVRVLCPADGFVESDWTMTTTALQREGWSEPPGTRWVIYHRRADALRPGLAAQSERGVAEAPQVAEFALGGAVLPQRTDTVRVAELFRRAALALHGVPSAVLAGKSADGRPLQGPHEHAHYLPDARGDGQRITHVVVYAPGRFSPSEVRALSRISFLPWRVREGEESVDGRVISERPRESRRDALDLDVVLCRLGQAADMQGVCRLFGSGRRWRSRTPFVLPRHVKRDRDRPEEQLLRELAHRGRPAPVEVRVVEEEWRRFRRRRWGDRDTTGATGFEMTFSAAQSGPILLGYGCHYGLGQFEPWDA